METKTQAESCPEMSLVPQALCIHLKGSLWNGNYLFCKFGEAWVPCLWSMKTELMWDVPALHKAKPTWLPQANCCEHQSSAHSAACYSQNHQCKAPPSLVAAPPNSFENLSLGLSATIHLWNWSAMHWVALVVGLSLYCEKLQTGSNSSIHVIGSGIASGY